MYTTNELINVLYECFIAGRLDVFSPMVIKGNPGMGKTYVLRQLLSLLKEDTTKIINTYNLVASFIETIKSGEGSSQWRTNLLNQPFLFIDDIDFIANRYATQDELLSVLREYDKPIIVTMVKSLPHGCFDDRFMSFLSRGARFDLPSPTLETKKEYVKKYLSENNIKLSNNDVLKWLCERPFTDYASIQGFMKTLKFHFAGDIITLKKCRNLYEIYR